MNNILSLATCCLIQTGDLNELARRLPLLLDEARNRDDVYTAVNLRLHATTTQLLAADQPDRAEAEIEGPSGSGPRTGSTSNTSWP